MLYQQDRNLTSESSYSRKEAMLGIDNSYLRQLTRGRNRLSISRRLKFGLAIVISEILLISLAIAWLVHMLLIAVNGSIYFAEGNPFILWGEIAVTLLITLFAIGVFAIQIDRLGERRRGEDRDKDS